MLPLPTLPAWLLRRHTPLMGAATCRWCTDALVGQQVPSSPGASAQPNALFADPAPAQWLQTFALFR